MHQQWPECDRKPKQLTTAVVQMPPFVFAAIFLITNLFVETLAIAAETPNSVSRALQQIRDVNALEAHAARASGKGTPDFKEGVYYSVLRQGIALLTGRKAAAERAGVLVRLTGELQGIAPQVDVQLDENKDVQQRIDQIIAQGKIGLRIFGGEIVRPGMFTSTVAIAPAGGSAGCTGSVIALNSEGGFILTAAHCVCSLKLRPGDNDGQVFFGNPNLNSNTETRKIVSSETKLMDPSFCTTYLAPATRGAICSPDLAVLRYSGKPPFAGFTVARFPNEKSANRSLAFRTEIVGFGAVDLPLATLDNGVRLLKIDAAAHKQSAQVNRMGSCSILPSCAISPRRHGCVPDDSEVLLFDSNGAIDTCNGDSGGPAFSVRENDNDRRLLAVTSRAKQSNGACGPGGIYVKAFTPAVITWLRDELRIPISIDP